MSGRMGFRWNVAAVYAAVSILLSSLLLALSGRHTLPLLEERFLFSAPAFVQARILVHLAARALYSVLPSAGILRIYQLLSAVSVMAVLLSFRRLINAVSTHTHT